MEKIVKWPCPVPPFRGNDNARWASAELPGLACHTEQEIAEEVGMPRVTVHDQIKELSKMAKWPKSTILSRYEEQRWKPPLYDVWKVQNKSNLTAHPGNSEAQWLDNLLYMFTKPFDIVVDPFAGGGSTIDVCKKRLRRYLVSDRLPIVERRDIRQWDILDGTPPLHKRWGQVALLFLDPPYWKQAEGKYSDDPQDLANMALDQFYAELSGFVTECASKMRTGSRIAMLMQPTQWKAPDKQVVDHVIDLIARLRDAPLRYARRISCPYESQQCTPQMVNWAKENRDVLVISRELVIWEVA